MKMIDYNLLRGKITAMQSTTPEYAYNFLNNALNPSTEWECIEDMIDSIEVYEAEPVKRGRWIITDDVEHFIAVCSECGRTEDSRCIKVMPYCHCGARMDGDAE